MIRRVTFVGLAWLAAVSAPAVPGIISPIQPKIVVQANIHIEAAAWTPDDKYIISADGITRGVTIWDVAERSIVDRMWLPTPPDWGNDFLYLTGIEISPDRRTATVHGVRAPISGEQHERQQDWAIDLDTRVVLAAPIGKALATRGADVFIARQTAMEEVYKPVSGTPDTAAIKTLAPLARSHDGRWAMARYPDGLELTGPTGSIRLTPSPPLAIGDAALSPSGKRVAFVVDKEIGDDVEGGTLVRIYDLLAGRNLRWLRPKGEYGRIRWIDEDLLMLADDGSDDSRDPADAGLSMPSPVLIIDTATGAVRFTLPPRCYTTLLNGTVFGAGLGNCRPGKGDHGLWLGLDSWTRLPDFLATGSVIDQLAGPLVGFRAAVAVTNRDKTLSLWVTDFDNPAKSDSLELAKGAFSAMAFSDDGRSLFVAANAQLFDWHPGEKGADGKPQPPRNFGIGSLAPQFMFSDGRTLMLSSLADSVVARYDLVTGKPIAPLDFANVVAGGEIAGRGLLWGASGAADGIRLWDKATGATVLTTYFFGNERFFAVTPEGRYDTNLGPDTRQFHWLMPDRPWQSLAPQTFMRDYYEPKLTERLIGCRAAGNCSTVFAPVRSIADINRVLPVVKIESIAAGATPETVVVTVAAREGVAERRSGLYNLRLFRGGQLVGQDPPDPADAARADLKGWQEANRLPVGPDGVARHAFTVAIATGIAAAKPVFTAYAFNDDRVKSGTASSTYLRPKVTPRPLRAFILTIGIDEYAEARLHLNFAAADAQLLGERLATIPGRNVRRMILTSAPATHHATKALIHAALQILAGNDVAAARTLLASAGVDTAAFESATPDDLVIISFAGHGWAAQNNDFYLAPSDTRWPDPSGSPDRGSLISAAELTRWLRDLDAGEMAIIIDACQSAAVVRADGFKPGPMGDPGLGQLAYDKRIRILAATQSSAAALEDPRLGHGLLTWALAHEGLDAAGFGQADRNDNGIISLDEWLGFAVSRLPKLSNELAAGALADGDTERGFRHRDAGARPPTQEPELFNFIQQPSPIVLRRKVKVQ